MNVRIIADSTADVSKETREKIEIITKHMTAYSISLIIREFKFRL